MATPDDLHWTPATFRERGAIVPFTSPLLAGARVRLVDRRADLVVPHPGGARGVYIFALASLNEFCPPTLHDAGLADHLAALSAPSPQTVRAAARVMAAEGAAGRAAAAAAVAADKADGLLRSSFVTALLAGLRLDHAAASAAAASQPVLLLAAQLAAAGLDTPGAGGPSAMVAGRCTRLLEAIAALSKEMRAWMATAGDQPAAAQVAAAAETMAIAGRLVLAAAHKPLHDPAALLGAWASAPDALIARLVRPDWLLDGWEHLCLLWRVAGTEDARAEAAAEASVLLPPIPAEAEAWFAAMPELQGRLCARTVAGPMPRAGGRVPSQLVNLMERNERVRALAA